MFREGDDVKERGKIIGKVIKADDKSIMVEKNGTPESMERSDKMVTQIYVNAYKAEMSEDEQFICVFVRKATKEQQEEYGGEGREAGEVIETEVVGRVNPSFNPAFHVALSRILGELKNGTKECDKREVDDMLSKVFQEIDDNKKS